MPRSMTPRTPTRYRRASAKIPRRFRLAPEKIAAAQRALGTATATETIETALDMVVFRGRLVTGTAAMLGVEIQAPDQEHP